jgi:hypothetical protein
MRKYSAWAIAVLGALAMLGFQSAQASPILDVSIGEIPFGPFSSSQAILITGTVNNPSPNEPLTICEGVCIGDTTTFSLGASSFIPTATTNNYSFFFGDGGDASLGFLDGQIAGLLNPGQTKDFVFAELVPISTVAPGQYGFNTSLQVFAATSDRPMIGNSSFGGNFQVAADVPEPSSRALFGAGLLGLLVFAAVRRRAPKG